MATKAKSNKNNGQPAAPETAQATEWAKQVVEHMVEAQKKWIEITQQQNAQAIKAMKDGLGLDENSPAAALADFAQQAVTNYVEVQKRWLELATQLPFIRSTK